jgi:Txe/YoeB family toxin of Txe-Axe toxin-antitoxin module
MVTSMQESVSRMLDRINQLIPDIDVDPRDGLRPSRRRATRGLLDFIGSASSYLFGTATEGEIGELRESIRKIEAMAETAAADASRTRDRLAEFTKLQNERTDSLSNVLREQHRMLETIYREVRTGSDASSMGYAAISYHGINALHGNSRQYSTVGIRFRRPSARSVNTQTRGSWDVGRSSEKRVPNNVSQGV